MMFFRTTNSYPIYIYYKHKLNEFFFPDRHWFTFYLFTYYVGWMFWYCFYFDFFVRIELYGFCLSLFNGYFNPSHQCQSFYFWLILSFTPMWVYSTIVLNWCWMHFQNQCLFFLNHEIILGQTKQSKNKHMILDNRFLSIQKVEEEEEKKMVCTFESCLTIYSSPD